MQKHNRLAIWPAMLDELELHGCVGERSDIAFYHIRLLGQVASEERGQVRATAGPKHVHH
jgi:hypothetical protein